MLIDWFTVGAQVLNFLILVWLMKRFLYKPILRAIDARETRIAKELADADARKADAQDERDEFQRKNEQFDRERAELLKKAIDEATAERHRLLEEARKSADAATVRRQEMLRNEAENLNRTILQRTQTEVFAITRQILQDLASTSLEERIGEVFTRRLGELNGEAKEGLADALRAASEPALVRSAFNLPPDQRAAIHKAISGFCASDVPVRFETAPNLISGIELTTNGQKVAWSIADYLASMEEGMGELLMPKEKTAGKSRRKLETRTP